jgi:hypothetical protein
VLDIVHEQVLSPLGPIFCVVAEKYVIEAESEQFLRCEQRHACLLRRSIALALITFDARSYQILRRTLTSLSTRENMVECEVLGVPVLAAVLTPVAVPNVDPRPFHCCFTAISPNVYIVPQPNHRRDRKGGRGRVENLVSIVLLEKYRAAKPQTHGTTDADRAERLK